jgi:DNA segregation ATPase FtsK/SpoIIIE, S-DNA-T family
MFNGEEGEMKQSEPLRKNNNSGRQQRQFSEQNKTEPKKEVEARVLYKYPKGQFKFPLIPDAEIEKNVAPKNVRRSNTRSKSTPTPTPKEKPVEKEHVPVKPMPKPKPKAPTPNLNRQPFRRTETPSPIFAFNRPKSDEIEYELNGFMPDGLKDVKKKVEEPSKVEAEGSREEAPIEEVTVAEEEIAVAQEEAPIEEEVAVAQEEAPIEEEVAVAQEEAPIEEEVAVAQEEAPIEEEIAVPQEEAQIEEEVAVAQEEAQIEEEIAVAQEEASIPKTELVFEKETEVQTICYNEPDKEMDTQQEQEPLLEQKISGEKPPETIEDVPVAATLEAAPERKKRQLPFNVLMLKQDKRKLEEQKNIADTILQKFNPVKTTRISEKEKETENKVEKETEKKIEIETDRKVETEAKSLETVQLAQLSNYEFPPLNLLQPPVMIETSREWLYSQELLLNETLKNFNVGARVVNVTQGPAVTRFEVQPEPGVKVNKITNLSDDIKLSLAARDIRIEAPIPGKHTIGIEVPNETSRPVLISEILQTSGFNENTSPLAVALGLDIAGTPVVTDLNKMPHGLIAGATGSGKSVCINTMLVSLLYKAHPDDVKLLLIDPKMVELAPYNQIPHLVSPVITDVKAATASLKWAVEEMERRYELFAHTGVRDISRFNELALEHKRYSEKLPYIVIVIDELADLMMMSPADVEEAICRIAQKARACGIHLIIATQRPSVDVITGLIKANVPTRVAFSVSSQVDSRTIIDISGAEKLLGRGDMLFLENGKSKPFRLQGTFVSDQEIDDIVAFVRKQRDPEYLFEQDELIKKSQITEDEDELFYEACLFVIEQGGASTSSIQRRFKIGYNRAARLIDMMEQNGFISEGRGSKPRDVLISIEDLDYFQENQSLT